MKTLLDSQDMRLSPTTTISELVALANQRDSRISIDIGDWLLSLEYRGALQEVRQTSLFTFITPCVFAWAYWRCC